MTEHNGNFTRGSARLEGTQLLGDRAPESRTNLSSLEIVRLERSFTTAARTTLTSCEGLGMSRQLVCEAALALVLSMYSRENFVAFFVCDERGDRLLNQSVDWNQSAEEWLKLFSSETAYLPTSEAAPGGVPIALGMTEQAQRLGAAFAVHVLEEGLALSWPGETRLGAEDADQLLRHVDKIIGQLSPTERKILKALSLIDDCDASALAFMHGASVVRPALTVHALFEAQVEKTPDRLAIRFCGDALTYAELNQLANVFAGHLREAGVQPGDLVGVLLSRSLELFVALFAILKNGAAYVPLDPSYPSERLQDMAADANLSLIITNGSDNKALTQGRNVTIDVNELRRYQGAVSNPTVDVGPSDLVYVMFTSGSTGRPKGTMVEHRNVVDCLLGSQHDYPLGHDDCFLQITPISFDPSVVQIFWPLSVGARVELAEPNGHKDAEYVTRLMSEARVTIIVLVPALFEHWLEYGQLEHCKSLRYVICGGEALATDIARRLAKRIPTAALHNVYGPTEATIYVTGWSCDPASTRNFCSIGRPCENTSICIIDEQRRLLPPGVPGELCIGGERVARGYLHRPELTEERFVILPWANQSARWYRTGDLASVNRDGTLEFLGRIDSQVKVNGFRIELGEIEAVLFAHASVSMVTVTVHDDSFGQRRLVAYFVPNGADVDPAAVLADIAAKLPEFMVPKALIPISEIPVSPTGKVDRKALPAPSFGEAISSADFVAPNSGEETQLCAIFAYVLRRKTVGATDSFFALGGTSLLAMQAMSRIRKELELDIPVATFFQYPTPRQLLSQLRASDPKANAIKTRGRRASSSANDESIAIVGMAGRFPGAASIDELWKLVQEGAQGNSRFSNEELDPSLSLELVRNPNYVPVRGVIADFDKFDAELFGISPRDAELLDPQHRFLLEASFEALENAGCSPDNYDGAIGVFVGTHGNTYLTHHIVPRADINTPENSAAIITHNEKDYAATRIAHRLNLTGPATTIQTACSTSLVAVVEAFYSLRAHRCDVAIAGGASITCPPRSGYLYVEGSMYSNDGMTRSFDADAAGTTFNDGVAVVVLKRLSDAQRDRDNIVAVLRGAATNNDGRNKSSFMAPSVEGQAEVIRMALDDAGVDARSIGYVEAHGTATPLGDPIEVAALTKAYQMDTQDSEYCALSSVKSNVGHLVAAAGATGLIRAALATREKVIPGTAHFKGANQHVDWAKSPFFVPSKCEPWETSGTRRAGVSSFGVGGTNAHVIVEEADLRADGTHSKRRYQLLPISGANRAALQELAGRHSSFFSQQTDLSLADAAYTLSLGRKYLSERTFVVAENVTEAGAAFGKFSALPVRRAKQGLDVAFLFPGQGAQAPRMGHSLYKSNPVFRTVVDQCAEIVRPKLNLDLTTLLYPEDAALAESEELLRNTRFTQPALFTVGYALAQTLMGLGIKPTMMVGHSVGEFVCAALAGVMSMEDALQLVAARAELMQSMPPGGMLSVRLASGDVTRFLSPNLGIASENSPRSCVVSGPFDDLERLEAALGTEGIICRRLLTSHAFHSSMMEPAVGPFTERVASVKLRPPRLPFISTLTGDWITDEAAQDPGYWGRHLRETVRFSSAIARVIEKQAFMFEVGPRATLVTLARQQSAKPDAILATQTIGSESDAEEKSLLTALGTAFSAGVDVDFAALYEAESRLKVPLPGYPFQRKRFWIEPVVQPSSSRGPVVIAQLSDFVSTTNTPHKDPEMSRTISLLPNLREIFETVSGFDIEVDSQDTSFLELGLDSLALTQVAQQLLRTYKVNVPFRDLMVKHTTLVQLATHLDQVLPREEKPIDPVVSLAAVPVSTTGAMFSSAVPVVPVVPVSASGVQALIEQQIALMRQQLGLLSGNVVTDGVALTPPAVAVTRTEVTQEAATLASSASLSPGAAAAQSSDADSPGEGERDQMKYDVKKAFGAIARIASHEQTALSPKQEVWLERFIQQYNEKTRASKELTQKNRRVLSDPRAVTGFRPVIKELVYQITIDRSKGSRVWDIDGNEYIDALNGFGSSLFGWQPDFITTAVKEQLEKGHEIGPMTPLAGEVAQLICDLTGQERAAFCNTGSEAVMGCLRAARTSTGRSTVAVFSGSYHGIFDEVVIRGAKRNRAVPAAPGIIPSSTQNMLVLEYGSDEALVLLRERGSELAAILVEPVQSRNADNQPREFLVELRKIADACGAVLIFDEVITGFRSNPGGAQAFFGVRADLASYGKVIGGGFPFGIVAGKARFMDALDGGYWEFGDDSVPTAGVTYFAGTFCRHPLALAAAKASLVHLKEQGPGLQERLNANTTGMVTRLNAFLEESGAPIKIKHFASLWKIFFTQDQTWGDMLFYSMRMRGIHILDIFPCFLTTAHSDEDIQAIERAFRESVTDLQLVGFLPGTPQAATLPFDGGRPPVDRARLGRDELGNPAWFVPDPARPGKYKKFAQGASA